MFEVRDRQRLLKYSNFKRLDGMLKDINPTVGFVSNSDWSLKNTEPNPPRFSRSNAFN